MIIVSITSIVNTIALWIGYFYGSIMFIGIVGIVIRLLLCLIKWIIEFIDIYPTKVRTKENVYRIRKVIHEYSLFAQLVDRTPDVVSYYVVEKRPKKRIFGKYEEIKRCKSMDEAITWRDIYIKNDEDVSLTLQHIKNKNKELEQ